MQGSGLGGRARERVRGLRPDTLGLKKCQVWPSSIPPLISLLPASVPVVFLTVVLCGKLF